MKPRLSALLVHGMGGNPAWWRPLMAVLDRMDIEAVAVDLPSLETGGPDRWVDAVRSRAAGLGPTVLIGHSLGAAVCCEAARTLRPEMVVMLACPPFLCGRPPPAPPQDSGLTATAVARVGLFLHRACAALSEMSTDAVHIVGESDRFVPMELARQLPVPVLSVKIATHDLMSSDLALDEIGRALARSACGTRLLDPGVRLRLVRASGVSPVASLDLGVRAADPARLDIEVTTRCQLACPHCARTLRRRGLPDRDMDAGAFEQAISEAPHAAELLFVGLGEPLLHPEIGRLTSAAARAVPTVRLVTNGLAATPERLARLRDAGLSEVVFSIDTLDETLFREIRGGASLGIVLDNFRGVPQGLTRSVFVTLSSPTVHGLPAVIDLAAEAGLPAVAVSDVNFGENQDRSLHATPSGPALAEAIRHAHKRGVLLIGPHFHNTRDVRADLRHYTVRLPADVSGRSATHQNCCAPWRIAVVAGDGSVSPCNCAPEVVLGTVCDRPLQQIWNGEKMQAWRTAMRAGEASACAGCPRY